MHKHQMVCDTLGAFQRRLLVYWGQKNSAQKYRRKHHEAAEPTDKKEISCAPVLSQAAAIIRGDEALSPWVNTDVTMLWQC